MLAAHAQAPVVPKTTVGSDLLQALQVLTQLAVHAVGQDLRILSIHNVALTIEEPGGDLVLGRVLNDGDDALEFFGGKLAGAVVEICVSGCTGRKRRMSEAYRLLRSTSAFLHTKLL